jgi:uncharacterized membrane protein YfbV (UPF0208 family)
MKASLLPTSPLLQLENIIKSNNTLSKAVESFFLTSRGQRSMSCWPKKEVLRTVTMRTRRMREVALLRVLPVNTFITLSKRAVGASLEAAKSILKFFHSYIEIKTFKESLTSIK